MFYLHLLLYAPCRRAAQGLPSSQQARLSYILSHRLFLATYDDTGIHTEQSVVMPQLPPASQVLADVMLSHWPLSAWQPQLPKGWTLNDTDTRRELRNPDGKLVTEIAYLNRNGRREPISIVQHAFHYHITIQYLGD